MPIHGFSDLSIVPVDFWHRHYLIYDQSFHKLATCDFYRGLWYVHSVCPEDSYMGLSRDDAIRSWLSYQVG